MVTEHYNTLSDLHVAAHELDIIYVDYVIDIDKLTLSYQYNK